MMDAVNARQPKIVQRRIAQTVELDAVDRELLRRLALDARAQNSSLAAAVGIAPSTCLMRVRRLQEAGVIVGFRAEVSPAALGRPLQALVSVRLHALARNRSGSSLSATPDCPAC